MSTLRVNNMTNVGGAGPTYATGHVVQVVHSLRAVAASTSSSTPVATGLEVSITPKNANSKLIIQVQVNGILKAGGYGGGGFVRTFIFKDGSFLQDIELAGGYNNTTSTQNVGGVGVTYSETAGSTVARTYQLYYALGAVGSAYIMHDNSSSSITVWEVAV